MLAQQISDVDKAKAWLRVEMRRLAEKAVSNLQRLYAIDESTPGLAEWQVELPAVVRLVLVERRAGRLAGWNLEAGRRLVEGLRTTFEEAARKGK